MDNITKGGNGNGHVEIEEFLSFMGHASEVWDMSYTNDSNDLVRDPWS